MLSEEIKDLINCLNNKSIDDIEDYLISFSEEAKKLEEENENLTNKIEAIKGFKDDIQYYLKEIDSECNR
jgi:hypothetical protein